MSEITKKEMRDRLGNIAQLQELLFGEKMEQYDLKFAQSERRLSKVESDLNALQLNTKKHLIQLEKSLIQNIHSAVNSLEKKFQYISLTTQEETHRLDDEIKNLAKMNRDRLDLLQTSLNSQTNNIKLEILQTKQTLKQDTQSLKRQISEQLEKNLTELSEGKVSRSDLAEILFELCIKVKGADFVPELEESQAEEIQADFILPQEKVNGKK